MADEVTEMARLHRAFSNLLLYKEQFSCYVIVSVGEKKAENVEIRDAKGAREALFQVTMLAYGYTFACKGTVQAFVKDLEHEAAVYERLRPVQRTSVPVFLRAVDLRSINKTYHYDHRVNIIYMMFLS
ncbi:hypothetical protein F4678DRAFT_455678 [Xylaria arbuscula]|nr:hypothetical protein F4678DRAFT_455678 [Xylaria arbuscula]